MRAPSSSFRCSPCARWALLGALLGFATAAPGCGSKAPAVTGLTVTVTMVGVAADQLRLGLTNDSGEVLMPMLRPLAATGTLASPQSVSIYLPDALADTVVTCTVTPFLAGQMTGAAVSKPATLVLHALVPLAIELDATPHDDGGAGDAADGAGQGGGGAGGAAGGAGGAAGGGAGAAGGASGAGGQGSKANGQPCGGDGECDSTLCRDGVCCASACGTLCQACNLPGKEGTCSPIPAGTAPGPKAAQCAGQPASTCSFDGTCDGSGGCRKYPAGVACKPAACNGASYLPASACDGLGACVAAKAVDCTPYNCSASTGVPACLSTCATGGTDCASPAVCANNSCGARPKKDNGAGCVADADCTSAHCADGVCCATVCTGACVSCNQTGTEGTCHSVGAGKADPHTVCKDAGASTCGRNGLCDSAGACALYPATTQCLAGSCKNSTLHPARHCDGKGVCVTPADVDCMNYRCDPATTACFTTCTIAALQCAARHACTSNVCQ